MDIIFICGSLEKGRDGVGDYCRRLASELMSQKWRVGLIALNDRFVNEILVTEQEQNGYRIPALRISKSQSGTARITCATEWINQQDPEWVSLQFVPYSFHDKGCPWNLTAKLLKMSKSRKWHIMFHELWIDGSNNTTRLISFFQQMIIRYMVFKLKPQLIHTHLPLYQLRLAKVDILAKKLPIFSNLHERKIEVKMRDEIFSIVFFSQFNPRPAVLRFLKSLMREIFLERKEVRIWLLGGNEEQRENLRCEIEKIPGLSGKIIMKGFLTDEILLQYITNSDLAITPVPRHVLGKSGSVAAFLSQGIPVAAPFVKPGFEEHKIGFFDKSIRSAIMTEPNLEAFRTSREAVKSVSSVFNIKPVTTRFLGDLKAVSVHNYQILHMFS